MMTNSATKPFPIEVRGYNAGVFANLHEFETAKHLLSLRRDRIEELLELITNHGMSNEVGITLLHKHFPLFEDERLIRRPLKDRVEVKPERLPTGELLPYMWTLGKADSRQSYGLYPLEFIAAGKHAPAMMKSVAALYQNQPFLFQFLEKLVELNLERVFGLSLLPKGLFKLKRGETLVENDQPGRRLEITVTTKTEVQATSSTQTLWVAAPRQGQQPQWCVIHCGIHCQVHCGIHCQIHCGVHCQIHCGVHNVPDPCIACQVNPSWPLAREALIRARNEGLVTKDNWQHLVNETVFTVAEISALAAVIAAVCGDCLTKEVFG